MKTSLKSFHLSTLILAALMSLTGGCNSLPAVDANCYNSALPSDIESVRINIKPQYRLRYTITRKNSETALNVVVSRQPDKTTIAAFSDSGMTVFVAEIHNGTALIKVNHSGLSSESLTGTMLTDLSLVGIVNSASDSGMRCDFQDRQWIKAHSAVLDTDILISKGNPLRCCAVRDGRILYQANITTIDNELDFIEIENYNYRYVSRIKLIK